MFLWSYTLVVEPMGVKFGMEEGDRRASYMPNFTPIGATCLKVGL